MAARYRNNVSSKHYVHVRRKGCTGSTRGSREGVGWGGEKSIAKMYILVRLKCNPHAIPHADIKGAWRRPYWPCMTFQHTGARLSTARLGRIPVFSGREVFGLPRENKRDVTKLCSVLQTFAKCTDALAACRGELKVRIFYTANWTDARNNWPQQRRKLIANIKIKKGDGLALL